MRIDGIGSRRRARDHHLIAELTDNSGWELLIKLAREHGQDDMAQDFEQALQSEGSHAAEVQHWLEAQVLEPA